MNIAITIGSAKFSGQYTGTRLAAMPDIRFDGQTCDVLGHLGQAYKLEVVSHSTGYNFTIFATAQNGEQVVIEENDHTGRVDITHYPFGVVVPETAKDRSDLVPAFLQQVAELRAAVINRADNIMEDNYWFDGNQAWHKSL